MLRHHLVSSPCQCRPVLAGSAYLLPTGCTRSCRLHDLGTSDTQRCDKSIMVVTLAVGVKMKIISWNVNGLRAAVRKGFLDWLHEQEGSIVGLQETRVLPEQLSA